LIFVCLSVFYGAKISIFFPGFAAGRGPRRNSAFALPDFRAHAMLQPPPLHRGERRDMLFDPMDVAG
jgi:hypothetical protein